MSGLVTFFERSQEDTLGTDPLGKAVHAFLKGEESGEALLFPLATYCESFSIDTPQDLIEYYRSFLSLLFLRKFYEKKDEKLDQEICTLILKGKKNGFGKHFYLQNGYEALASYLFENKKGELEFKQLEKGAILHRDLPNPMQNGEIGLIALYLGLVWDDEDLLHRGLKCVEFSLSLCDHRGKLFQGLWLKESEYQSIAHNDTFALLFDIASCFSHSSKLQMASENFSDKKYSDPFILLFNQAFEKRPFPSLSQGLTLHDIDRSLGFIRYQYGDTSLASSAAGVNTGLGSIHKKGIHIVSMGPHYAPLADSDYYGIFRLSNGSQEGFKDLKIESGEEIGKFQGWTRMASPDEGEPSEEWLYFNLEAEREKIDLTVRKSHHNELNPLFYVFFISADKGTIGEEKVLYPGILERYQGKTHQVVFEKGEEKVEITPHFDGEMKLIPLAGKDHFWSADFLLAFSLKKKLYPYHWTVN
ncbi:MAG: hypothetical protein KFB93_07455 [Simkaniaceae bacterium]|nr:MAG: hypothetical protein KFB93_07455 [Simkaniaceae bacterium]